jgi:dATP/dGTP diphosphohydrolase
MVRDTEADKLDYSLIFDGPMLKRWAAHLTKGAQKYSPRNWMKASGEAELERFKRSFLRHAVAYLDGETDEDHAAAIIFNINGMEYVRAQRADPPTYIADDDYPEDPHQTWE